MVKTIENPIINSPYQEPDRHFCFDSLGITDIIVNYRRLSSYFLPVATPRKRNNTITEWTSDRIEENHFVNELRGKVAKWRQIGFPEITPITRQLLSYWTDKNRDNKLFFCQIESLETIIYITESSKRLNDVWTINKLEEANKLCNQGLPRFAFKMATGTGKTVVMAMLIAWQTLNKLAAPSDSRFSDTFLIITPGITIRDRLRVLLPTDSHNYYRQRDILPPNMIEQMLRAKILITNYHSFILREKIRTGKITKAILAQGENGLFTESPAQMVNRVCREFAGRRNIIVINDEAHHCYHRNTVDYSEKISSDDKFDIKIREEEARVWISGIETIKNKLGIKAIYDLSATPFFLKGSGYPEGTLFPWVVSDFSLIDAIESGLVKVPRVPIDDDSMTGEQPTYRNLWARISDTLPKKSRSSSRISGEPQLPLVLQGALHRLYSNY